MKAWEIQNVAPVFCLQNLPLGTPKVQTDMVYNNTILLVSSYITLS